MDQVLLDALVYAADKHKHQTRKGESKAPYINHPIEVARILSRAGEKDSDLLVAAFLHDVIEDCAEGDDEIKELSIEIGKRFGERVLRIVKEVTDDKSLDVKVRKHLQVMHTPTLSSGAKKLKIADKSSNILDIKNDPPKKWSINRKMEYLDWAKQVVDGARGLNAQLENYFDQVYSEVYEYLRKKK